MEFSDYVRTQRRSLLRFATVLTGQPWLAEDLVSDVLGKCYERWDRIDGTERPHAYVRRMIVNEHLSWRRRLDRRSASNELTEASARVDDGSASRADREEMIGRLAQLPPRQRAAVVLRYYIGLDDAEIADELGCRESTVRSQISRALQTLRIDLTSPTSPLASHLETR